MKYIFALSMFVSVLNIVLSSLMYSSNLCILNTGVAFGFNIGWEILTSEMLIICLLFVGAKREKNDKYLFFSLCVLGLSNLFVRIIYDGVCDYLHLYGLFFNLVDIFILFICIYLLFLLIKTDKRYK